MDNSSDEEVNSDEEVIDLRPLWRNRPFLSESSSEEDNPEEKASDSPPRVIELPPLIENEEISPPTRPFASMVAQLHDDMNTRLAQARAIRENILRERGLRPRNMDASLQPSQHPWTYPLTYLDEETIRSLNESQSGLLNSVRNLGDSSSNPTLPIHGRPFASVTSGVGRLVEAFNDDDELDVENTDHHSSRFVLPEALDKRDNEQ